MVIDWLEACKSVPKLEVFTNTVLGEVWKPVEQIEYEDLTWNLETYPAKVPPGVLILTAGVDMQKDRLECEVVGWGMNDESWSIAYRVFEGQTGVDFVEGDEDCGRRRSRTAVERVGRARGVPVVELPGPGNAGFRIQAACVDSGI
jgi:phage terminase large subunit GpA-like protein